ncbi:MAG: hypothetical protein RUDDFDWM_000774 [Candidatus Fervidibacterota bacterium]
MHCKIARKNGQAVIIAVMLITGVALVSAGFVAFVAGSLHHARTLTGKASGRELAMYGIEYAMQQLLAEGANWRPIDQGLPWDAYEKRRGWDKEGYVKLPSSNGYFLLRLSLRDDGYIQIDSIGRPEERSPVYYKITAIVPNPLIQYALFLTGRNIKHSFGRGQIDFDRDGTISQLEENSCKLEINGGVFVNDSLSIVKDSLLKFLFNRNKATDGLFVAGKIEVKDAKSIELCDENGNLIDESKPPQDSDSPNFWIFPLNNIPRYRDGYYYRKAQLIDSSGVAIYRRLRPLPAPRIIRFLPIGTVNTVGGIITGSDIQALYICINNDGDIQNAIHGAPSGSPARVQLWDWLNVPDINDQRRNDPKSGWYIHPPSDPYRRNPSIDNTPADYLRYVPPGCEIELKTNTIEIKRHDDPDKDGRIWEDPINGSDDDGDGKIDEDPPIILCSLPGNLPHLVIFAEGNVRIKGQINASLTVISMGSIYIEGSLKTLHPTTQHIVLLAKQNVCLNTTALLPRIISCNLPDKITIQPDKGQSWDNDTLPLHYEFPAISSQPVEIMWEIPDPDYSGYKVALTLFHSGSDDSNGYCPIEIYINGSKKFDGEPLCYPVIDPDNDGKIGEDPSNKKDDDKDGRTDEDPGTPQRCYYNDCNHGIYWIEGLPHSKFRFSVKAGVPNADNDNDGRIDEDPIDGVDNDNDGKVDEDPPERSYCLSRFKVELLDRNGNPLPLWKIEVNAIIYAESGCFFILSPPFFDSSKTGTAAQRFLRFNYFDITINGTIVEWTTPETMDKNAVKIPDKLAYPLYDSNGNLVRWRLPLFRYNPLTLFQHYPPLLPVSPRPIIIYSGL